MSEDEIEALATKYAVPGSNGRIVEYLSCFRTYMLQAASMFKPSKSQLDIEKTKQNEMSLFNNTSDMYNTNKHPWEIEYLKSVDRNKPYWAIANIPKVVTPVTLSIEKIPPPSVKGIVL